MVARDKNLGNNDGSGDHMSEEGQATLKEAG